MHVCKGSLIVISLLSLPLLANAQDQSRPRLPVRFASANTTRDGCLTLQQAIDGGLPAVASHFSEIDVKKKGCVTLDQIREFRLEAKSERLKGEPMAPVSPASPPVKQTSLSQNPAAALSSSTATQGAPSQLGKFLEAMVETDSASWLMNKYDRGSIRNAKVLSVSQSTKIAVVYADYTFNRGTRGWLKAKIENGAVACVEFWDFGQCRPVGNSYSHAIVAGLAIAAFSGDDGGSSSGHGSGSSSSDPRGYRDWQHSLNPQNIPDSSGHLGN